tara:strand:+ start:1228 stop:2187 length:960 start_codon:yes stop_codon:yes gene_type:complete
MSRYNKVNVRAAAREYRERGYSRPDTCPFSSTPSGKAEAHSVWEIDGKPVRYALIAVLLDRAIGRALSLREERPPFGLIKTTGLNTDYRDEVVESLNLRNPFENLIYFMRNTLEAAARDEWSAIERMEGDEISRRVRSVYEGFRAISEFNIRYMLFERPDHADMIPHLTDEMVDSKLRFELNAGHKTALEWMSGVLGILPSVFISSFGEGASPGELGEIARRSYSLFRYAASMHIYDLETLERVSKKRHRLDPSVFRIDHESRRLVLRAEKRTELEELCSREKPHKSPRVGCPATVRFDEKSVAERLWHWHVDIAEQVW